MLDIFGCFLKISFPVSSVVVVETCGNHQGAAKESELSLLKADKEKDGSSLVVRAVHGC